MRLGSASGVTHLATVGRRPDVPGGGASTHLQHLPPAWGGVGPSRQCPPMGPTPLPQPGKTPVPMVAGFTPKPTEAPTGPPSEPKDPGTPAPILGVLSSLWGGVPGDPRGGHWGESSPQFHRGACRWHVPGPSRMPAAHGSCAPAQEGGGFPPPPTPASAGTQRWHRAHAAPRPPAALPITPCFCTAASACGDAAGEGHGANTGCGEVGGDTTPTWD